MSTPPDRAAAVAAVGALTEFLAAQEAGAPRSLRDYLQQLVSDDGAGALAQGYYGLLHLAALLLPAAAAAEGVAPGELLSRIGLRLALDASLDPDAGSHPPAGSDAEARLDPEDGAGRVDPPSG